MTTQREPHLDTILIVNDNADQLELLSVLLGRAGYDVLAAGDGREGLQIARRARPRLVISDVVMGGVDGIELCRAIRADAGLRAVPILLVSALRKDTPSVVEGLNAGADDYLEAPYEPSLLVAKAARLVERARLEEALREADERFRLLVEGVKDYAIFMVDPGGRITSWNKGVERVLGYGEAEFVGRHVSCVFTPEDVESGVPEQEMRTAETAGQADDERWHLRRDGTRFWASGVVTPLHGEDGGLRGFSKVMRDNTERRMAEERMAHTASHDTLTGLPNRALFVEHLRRAIAYGKRHQDYLFAVLFLDLDRFKVINDGLGHVVADQLLVAIARKLGAILRPEDIFARFGGDEFTILLDDIGDVSDATRVAERIHKELATTFRLDRHEVFTTASIGVALSSHGYETPEDVLRDADTAMYRAKAEGRARYMLFDREMHERAAALLELETALRRAVKREEFRVHYQPIISLATNRVAGFEALLRWQHPERGLLFPAEFIEVAEETGLIIPVGQWLLREACRQASAWQAAANADPPLALSVNLCIRQFSQPDLVEQIAHVTRESGFAPRDLKLEITESMVMGSGAAASGVFQRLRDIGVKLYIDDFGTGYSSLSYLHRVPIDTLKIDRSFVSRMEDGEEDLEIVRTIIQLAHNLKMEVIAEGIETAGQLARLRALGCEYGQGYFFSEPVDAETAGTLIQL